MKHTCPFASRTPRANCSSFLKNDAGDCEVEEYIPASERELRRRRVGLDSSSAFIMFPSRLKAHCIERREIDGDHVKPTSSHSSAVIIF